MLVTRVLSFPTGWRCLTVAVPTPYPTCTALSDDNHIFSQWQEVLPGEVISFEFEAREKLRHRHTHELKLLLVRVGGWEQVKLVSVDKVVVFYRYATLLTRPISRPSIIHPHVYVGCRRTSLCVRSCLFPLVPRTMWCYTTSTNACSVSPSTSSQEALKILISAPYWLFNKTVCRDLVGWVEQDYQQPTSEQTRVHSLPGSHQRRASGGRES
ncbi:uncharacterized protein LOC115132786 [Oncorhynchus nerka]|uniref:uncharacterized protein LOC115132786 n=1 Tax=Oncorhynchus nerka TaxID=8023 RepID=UPI0011318215|nr:uncharacterized protein LOC115132786 [Oncorhynchus nerka]